MLKKDLRTHYINKRKTLTKQQFWLLNDGILNQLSFFDWDLYNYISLFLPIVKQNEIDTFELIAYFKLNHPHVKICLPKANFNDCSLKHLLFTPDTVLVENKYNIPEPLYGNVILPTQIDVVFVPLLAYDLEGYRVGYGKGFYDRFLAQCNPNVLKIGLSLFEAENHIADVDVFDIKLNHCLSPDKIYSF